MVTVETISIVIAAASVVVAAFSMIQQNREAKRLRQTELFMPIYSRFQEKEFNKLLMDIMSNWEWEDFDDFMEKYGPETNLEACASFFTVLGFYDVVGVLLMRKQIDPTLVYNLMPASPVRFWEKMGTIIKEGRKSWWTPRFMPPSEYLANEMMKRQQLEAIYPSLPPLSSPHTLFFTGISI